MHCELILPYNVNPGQTVPPYGLPSGVTDALKSRYVRNKLQHSGGAYDIFSS